MITEVMVENLLLELDASKGGVSGDISANLYKLSAGVIARLVADLYNKVARSGIWPKRWKIEHSFSLKKVPNPQTLNDIRAISRSPTLVHNLRKLWSIGC